MWAANIAQEREFFGALDSPAALRLYLENYSYRDLSATLKDKKQAVLRQLDHVGIFDELGGKSLYALIRSDKNRKSFAIESYLRARLSEFSRFLLSLQINVDSSVENRVNDETWWTYVMDDEVEPSNHQQATESNYDGEIATQLRDRIDHYRAHLEGCVSRLTSRSVRLECRHTDTLGTTTLAQSCAAEAS